MVTVVIRAAAGLVSHVLNEDNQVRDPYRASPTQTTPVTSQSPRIAAPR